MSRETKQGFESGWEPRRAGRTSHACQLAKSINQAIDRQKNTITILRCFFSQNRKVYNYLHYLHWGRQGRGNVCDLNFDDTFTQLN
jgi:hypothetical protein